MILDMPIFEYFKGSCPECSWKKLHVIFKVRSFKRFGEVVHWSANRYTDRHRHTLKENIIQPFSRFTWCR